MQLTFASYNIHKGIGADGQRNPPRILDVIDELEADVVALQEVDIRFGDRQSVLDLGDIEKRGWQVAAVPTKPNSMGWHGNALLVRRGIDILDIAAENLPQIEPRGAVRARLRLEQAELCVTAMHLDLSGLLRKRQFSHLCNASRAPGLPAVMMGDCNEWMKPFGGDRGLAAHWEMVIPGKSFPARKPMLELDRVMHTPHWKCVNAAVHSSTAARQASDHLPIRAELSLIKN
ncbi:endonuclease/exonuclease/phosphatase family protein [Aurantiacibacter sediminis]|uniref:Endonuclease/exonuclease/phosphatase family protein n=1 Tax=Aurantiacibacter sediminis TaxID=2793064 RepID=A0ABS0N0N3_9SPHN|nr:endonuclease/exonuclease/phosphatase family protein [Aurantiacibacter sediminis]MBH5321531.1 endonuclease/exonuclease/phosphatase family protein [Aurantiacibacter sediminis]